MSAKFRLVAAVAVLAATVVAGAITFADALQQRTPSHRILPIAPDQAPLEAFAASDQAENDAEK